MQRPVSGFFQHALCFGAALLLAGCSLGTVNPDTIAAPVAGVAGPALRGSVYGGHAPLVGARVFILQPNFSVNNGASFSIGTYTNAPSYTPSGGGFPLASDPTHLDGNGLASYYVTTDQSGAFNITNDYVCTPGVPVYLAATGGVPFFSTSVSTFALGSSVVVAGSGATQTATFTIDTSKYAAYPPFELFFSGETITLGGTTTPATTTVPAGGAPIIALGGALAALNGTTAVVQSTGLTTTSFTVSIAAPSITAGTYTLPAAPATAYGNSPSGTVTGISPNTANNNPSITNMAYLGTCPASGATNFGSASNAPISYIWMNEVSTAALAFATSPFATDPFHIGVNATSTGTLPSGLTRGQYVRMGLLEAFNNAAVLYDIQGGNVTTTFAGEGHTARIITPSGNGFVSNSKLNTIGNILAACVDSANTSTVRSASCATLFANTSSTGLSCTVGAAPTFTITCPNGTTAPTDTGTAAFNLAHFPSGTAVGPTMNNAPNIATLYALPTGNVPFSPNISSSSDFVLEIEWSVPPAAVTDGGLSTSVLNGPNDIAIDGGVQQADGTYKQSAWIASDYGNAAKIFVSGGVPDYAAINNLRASDGAAAGVCPASANFTCQTDQIAIDPTNNVYILSQDKNNNVTKWTAAGAYAGVFNNYNNSSTFNYANSLVLDAGNNLLIANTGAGTVVKLPSGFTAATVPTILSPASTSCTGVHTANSALGPATILLDKTNTYAYVYNANTLTLCIINASTGALVTTGGGLTNNIRDGMNVASFGSLTSTNSYAVGAYYTGFNELEAINTAGALTQTFNFTGSKSAGGISVGSSTAIDGAGTIWAGSTQTWSLAALDTSGNWLTGNGFDANYFGPGAGAYYGPGSQPNPYPNGNYSDTNGAFPAIDAAGNVWIAFRGTSNPGPQVIYEAIGVAVPTWQPLAYQVNNSLTGVRPQ